MSTASTTQPGRTDVSVSAAVSSSSLLLYSTHPASVAAATPTVASPTRRHRRRRPRPFDTTGTPCHTAVSAALTHRPVTGHHLGPICLHNGICR